MKKLKGLELTSETANILLENNKFLQYINEHSLDYYQFGVVASDEEAVHLESFLIKNGIFETTVPLYKLENPELKQTFTDFGFISTENNYYLYEELVIHFSISGYNERDVRMALEQMDEHLVAEDKSPNKTFYFVERYHQELIEGIADAYKVDVTFY